MLERGEAVKEGLVNLPVLKRPTFLDLGKHDVGGILSMGKTEKMAYFVGEQTATAGG